MIMSTLYILGECIHRNYIVEHLYPLKFPTDMTEYSTHVQFLTLKVARYFFCITERVQYMLYSLFESCTSVQKSISAEKN